MAGLKPLFIGLLLTGLFAFAMITGGIMVADQNSGVVSIGDDPALSNYKTQIQSSLNDASTDANSSLEALGNSPLSAIPGAFIFEAIAGVWKTLKIVPSTIYNLTFGVLKDKVFGDSFGVAFGIMAAIIIILIILGVIKLVVSGQDE